MTAPPGREDQSQRDPAAEQSSTLPIGAVEPGPVGTTAQEPGGRKAGAAGVTDKLLHRMASAPIGKGQPGLYAADSQADITEAAPATLPRQATTAQGEPSMASSGDQPESREQRPEKGVAKPALAGLHPQVTPTQAEPSAVAGGVGPEPVASAFEVGLQPDAEPATIAMGLDLLKVSSDIGIGGDIPPGPIQEPESSPATGPARRPPRAQSRDEPNPAVPPAQSQAKGSQLAAESAPGDPTSPAPDLSAMNRGSPMETSFTRETARPTGQLGGPKSQASGAIDELVWSPPPNTGGGEPAIPAGGLHAQAMAESPDLRPMPQPLRPAGPAAEFSQGTATTHPLAEAGDKTGPLGDFPPVIDQSPLPSKPLAAAYPRARARVNTVAPRLRSEDPTAGSPPIEVRIDRIEITSPPAVQKAPPPSEAPAGPVLSLDDYLRQRDEGKA